MQFKDSAAILSDQGTRLTPAEVSAHQHSQWCGRLGGAGSAAGRRPLSVPRGSLSEASLTSEALFPSSPVPPNPGTHSADQTQLWHQTGTVVLPHSAPRCSLAPAASLCTGSVRVCFGGGPAAAGSEALVGGQGPALPTPDAAVRVEASGGPTTAPSSPLPPAAGSATAGSTAIRGVVQAHLRHTWRGVCSFPSAASSTAAAAGESPKAKKPPSSLPAWHSRIQDECDRRMSVACEGTLSRSVSMFHVVHETRSNPCHCHSCPKTHGKKKNAKPYILTMLMGFRYRYFPHPLPTELALFPFLHAQGVTTHGMTSLCSYHTPSGPGKFKADEQTASSGHYHHRTHSRQTHGSTMTHGWPRSISPRSARP